ncbi:hypothetical protein MKW92_020440 [Papaver armeniacum]|nr:hypothetical protein MKW92_020440 [Papaver armeniacum]
MPNTIGGGIEDNNNYDMTKVSNSNTSTPDNSVKLEKKKKSIIPKLFSSKARKNSDDDLFGGNDSDHDLEKRIASKRTAFIESSPVMRKSFSERLAKNSEIEGLNLSNFERPMTSQSETQDFRIFVATWNVGGKAPNNGLNLEDFLQVEGSSDIYILGFQEIVPLNAGNVLVIEDNEPAAKWLAIISQALNRPHENQPDFSNNNTSSSSSSITNTNCNDLSSKADTNMKTSSQGGLFFHKPSLKVLSRHLRVDSQNLKSCNCHLDSSPPYNEKQHPRDINNLIHKFEKAGSLCIRNGSADDREYFSMAAGIPLSPSYSSASCDLNYRLVTSKQMVGLFLSVWARKELVQYIAHLRVSSIGRGIMGCLGNKGCISVSMSFHKTTYCFVCSHLASGEKEGDELRRNSDVAEILKATQFPKICKKSDRRIPERIIEHDQIIWLGDLNYRVSLSYEETKLHLEENDWETLLQKDQLNIERHAGRVFKGWNEGKIFFAPTYKYSQNSDSYAGETTKSKKKRRTPAWCDRILWYGNGIEQLSYIRGESRFSDHRPVCAVFTSKVVMMNNSCTTPRIEKFKKRYSVQPGRTEYEDVVPKRHSFYGFY